MIPARIEPSLYLNYSYYESLTGIKTLYYWLNRRGSIDEYRKLICKRVECNFMAVL